MSNISRRGILPNVGYKSPVVVVTAANITLSGSQLIGTVTVVNLDRVLVAAQTDATENGIYDVNAAGTWKRSRDFNDLEDVVNGVQVLDTSDSVVYHADFTPPFIVGTTVINFNAIFAAGALWGGILGTLSDQTDVQAAIDAKADTSHGHAQAEVTSLVSDLAGKSPTVHTHVQSEVTSLVSDLAGKSPTVHTHVQSEVTDLSHNVNSRNTALNQDPVTQPLSNRTGFSATIYTGSGSSNPITTGVDMSTGNLGGLVWIKQRSAVARSHILSDTVRGIASQLSSDNTGVEGTDGQSVTSFDSAGFTIGTTVNVNESPDTYIAWSWQTTKIKTGTTNRGKSYTAHYNPDMGFSIVGYEGDGVDGHEIPHHLSVVPELSIFKNRDSVESWIVSSFGYANTEHLQLHATTALSSTAQITAIRNENTVQIGNHASLNESASNIISYHFASKSGVCKIGKYIGTGAAGNYVSTKVLGGDAFKPGFVLIKSLATNSWIIQDGIRGENYLVPDTTAAEVAAGTEDVDFVDDGFVSTSTGALVNALNAEYIFMAFVETTVDATKTEADYSHPTTPATLEIVQNSLISFANGFDALGPIDTQENVGAAITKVLGATFEDRHYWLYKNKASTYEVTENRPLEGIKRDDADKWGVASPLDKTLRTTAHHFDYESETGVALASGAEVTNEESFRAFDKNRNNLSTSKWSVLSTTTSTLQYKQTEKRILKSWRMRASDDADTIPRRFDIEGSNDGNSWTVIDATYNASDFTDPGVGIWSALQTVPENITAYLYLRINTTLNHGDASATEIAELEFNTILPSDYYLIEEAKMFEYLGAELVTQLTTYANQAAFDVDWTRGANVTFDLTNDEIDFAVSSGVTTQGGAIATIGKRYEVLFTIANFSSGTIAASFGGATAQTGLAANGVYGAIVTATTTAGLVFTPDGGFVGSAKVLSVKLLGNPVERTYLAELQTDSVGDVTTFENLPVAKRRFSGVEVHNDLTVHKEIHNKGICTAWVSFDATQNPPLIQDAFNIRDIVDLSLGVYEAWFETPMDNVGYGFSTTAEGVGGASASMSGISNIDDANLKYIPVSMVINGSNSDTPKFSITIFGGKEIL